MSYNPKKTVFDNYLLKLATKIGNPGDDLYPEDTTYLSVHEQIEYAIDAYLKHGKHNQKSHGRRFGADTGGGSGGVTTGASGGAGGDVGLPGPISRAKLVESMTTSNSRLKKMTSGFADTVIKGADKQRAEIDQARRAVESRPDSESKKRALQTLDKADKVHEEQRRAVEDISNFVKKYKSKPYSEAQANRIVDAFQLGREVSALTQSALSN